jgi:hypothetical protein
MPAPTSRITGLRVACVCCLRFFMMYWNLRFWLKSTAVAFKLGFLLRIPWVFLVWVNFIFARLILKVLVTYTWKYLLI